LSPYNSALHIVERPLATVNGNCSCQFDYVSRARRSADRIFFD
jgi:hypothetical protein